MPQILLKYAKQASPWIMLCGVSVVFNSLGDVLGLMCCKCSSENGQVLVGFQSTEAFGCLHHAGGGPAQRHRGVSPSLHVATDAAHGPHHVLNGVGAGERTPERYRQAEAVDGQHLVESFKDAGSDTGRLLIKAAGEIAQQSARLYRHRRAPKPAGGPGVPMHAAAWAAARSRCGLYEAGNAGSVCGRRRCDG